VGQLTDPAQDPVNIQLGVSRGRGFGERPLSFSKGKLAKETSMPLGRGAPAARVHFPQTPARQGVWIDAATPPG
jgi:hypothetical protein